MDKPIKVSRFWDAHKPYFKIIDNIDVAFEKMKKIDSSSIVINETLKSELIVSRFDNRYECFYILKPDELVEEFGAATLQVFNADLLGWKEKKAIINVYREGIWVDLLESKASSFYSKISKSPFGLINDRYLL